MKKNRFRANNIGNHLKSAAIALTNAQGDANINAPLADFGFSATRLDEGQALYDAATSKVALATAGRGEYGVATENVKKSRKVVIKAYQDLAKVARALFIESPGALASLGANQVMPRTNGPLLRAAQTLFNSTAYPAEVATALAAHGYAEAKLTQERAKVDDFAAALAAQGEQRGTAQQARVDQTAALTALRKWVARFRKIARVALGDRQKELEKLGIVSLVMPTPAQRAGRRKASETRRLKREAAILALPKAA
jgi:hypothetical protein